MKLKFKIVGILTAFIILTVVSSCDRHICDAYAGKGEVEFQEIDINNNPVDDKKELIRV